MVITLFGCADEAKLSITFGTGQYGPPIGVDTRCDNGGCEGPVQLEVQVSVEAKDHPNAAFEILQYRVDYDLSGVEEQVPYFAGVTSLNVSADTPATLNVHAAGERQREWVLSRYGYDSIDGTATLTLAGYDQDDKVITSEAPFDIQFGDFPSGGGGDKDGGSEDAP